MSSKARDLTFPRLDFFVRIFGNEVFLVGGLVRDFLIRGRLDTHKDIDLIVVGATYQEIEKRLRPFGKTNTVGKSFAVVKFTVDGQAFDISIPRRDMKLEPASRSHRNFRVDSGPHVSLHEDLYRRDFTCNSIAMRLSDRSLFDPFEGAKAIREKKILMTNPESFSDDPLRVLRAARFASKLRFSMDPAIYTQAAAIRLDELSAERISEELLRLLLESPRPGRGLDEYWRLAVLEQLFPELYAMSLVLQDARFHPETDQQGHHTVWAHTLVTVDLAKKLVKMFSLDEERSLALLLAALLHDIGKAGTTRWEYKRGRMTVTSALHDSRGMELAESFLDRLKIETRRHFPLKSVILSLVQFHHRIFELYRNRREISFKAIARLVKDMAGEDYLLVLLDFADRQSRMPRPLSFKELDVIFHWYRRQQQKYNISQESIRPLILGRDLISIGVTPGLMMGKYLKRLYDLQLEGKFSTREEGLHLFSRLLAGGKAK